MSEKSFVVVCQSDMNTSCSAGPIYNPRMVISVDDQCHAQMEFQVFFFHFKPSLRKLAYSCEAADSHLESILRGNQNLLFVLVFLSTHWKFASRARTTRNASYLSTS